MQPILATGYLVFVFTGLTLLVVWLGVLPASLLSIIRAPGPIVR